MSSSSTGTKVNALLYWAQNATKSYDNVEIKTFSSPSFANGLGFCAIIHHFRPDLIPYDTLTTLNAKHNLDLAFRVAEHELGCTQYLETEDLLNCARPEPKTIQMQLNEYRRVLGSANEIHKKNSDFGDLVKDYEDGQSSLKRFATMPPKSLENPNTLLNSTNNSNANVPPLSNSNLLASSKLSIQSSSGGNGNEEPKKGIVARQKEAYLQETKPSISITSSNSSSSSNSTDQLKNLDDAKKKIMDLYEQVSSLRTDGDNIRRENSDLSLKFKEAQHAKDETELVFKQQNENLKKKIAQQRQDMEDEKNSKLTLESSITKLKQELEVVKKESVEYKKKIEALEKLQESMKKETKPTDSSSASTDLQKQVADLNNQIKQKERIISQFETEKISTFKDLQQKLAEKEKDIQNLKNSLKNLNEECEKSKIEKESLYSEHSNQQRELSSEIDNLQHSLKQVKMDKQMAERKAEDSEMQRSDLVQKLSLLQKELEDSKKNLTSRMSESQKFEQELKNLKELHSKLSSEISDKNKLLEKEKLNLREGNEKSLNEKQALERQIQDLKNQLSKNGDSTSKELDKSILESKKLNETINKLTTELSTLKKEKETFKSEKEATELLMKRQANDLEQKYQEKIDQSLEQIKNSSKHEQSNLSAQIEDLRDRIDELKREKQSVQEELVQAQHQKNHEIEEFKNKISQLESTNKSASTTTSSAVNLSKLIEQERKERFVLDQSILCVENCTFSNQIPTPVKSIYHALNYWLESSETFGVNLVSSLTYKFNSYISYDLQKSAYWLNVMIRILHLLKSEQEYEKKIKSILKNNVNEKQFTALTSNEQVSNKEFLVLSHVSLSGGDGKQSQSSLDKFFITLSQLIYDCYFEIIKSMLLKAKPLILEKLFGVGGGSKNTVPTLGKISGDVKIDVIVKNMASWMDQIKDSYLDSRLIIHMFESLAHLMDSFIFNQFITFISAEKEKTRNINPLRDATMNHAIHLKMSVSFLESFFFEEHLTAGLDIQNLFHQTREAADVCVLGQKDLLQKGNDLREIVCPHLVTSQIAVLLLESVTTPQNLIVPTLAPCGFTDPVTFAKQQLPLFDFETKFMTIQSLQTVQYPSIFEKHKQEYPFLFRLTKNNKNGSTTTTTSSNDDDDEEDYTNSSWTSPSKQTILTSGTANTATSNKGSNNSPSSSGVQQDKRRGQRMDRLDLNNGLFE